MTNVDNNLLVPLFVLGVRSNYRGKLLESQLQNLGLQYKNIWGIEISDFDTQFLESMLDSRKSKFLRGRRLTHGELSCSLGHLEMYEEFLLTHKQWGFFLEDDISLNPDFDLLNLINSLPDELPPTIVTLASSASKNFAPRPFPFLERRLLFSKSIEFRQCAVAPVGAYAYFMNRPAAQIATHELRSRRVFSVADFPFQFRNKVDFFASQLEFVATGNEASLLEAERGALPKRDRHMAWRKNLNRRFRVLFDYSGLGLVMAKYLGLSGRDYFKEFISLRREYKRFYKGKSSKFFR